MSEDPVAQAAKLREFQRRQFRRELAISAGVVLGIAATVLGVLWLLGRVLMP